MMYGDENIKLSPDGIKLMEEYGSYTSYMVNLIYKNDENVHKKYKRLRFKERIEFILKNTSTVVAIILGLSTVSVTILSIFDKRELKSLEQEVKQLRMAQDTLIQKLHLPQMTSNSLPAKKDSMP